MRPLILTVMVLVLGASVLGPVRAQEATVIPEATLVRESPSPTPEPEESGSKGGDQPAPVDTSTEAARIVQSTIDEYFRLVEQYRDAESKYKIARDQYYSLNTLQSLEDAVSRGRDLLEVRSQVLLQYLRYLTLLVEQTNGIDQGDKEAALTALSNESIVLAQYQNATKEFTRRAEIDAHFAELNARETSIMNVVFGSLSLVKVGEMQTALDMSGVLADDLAAWLQSADVTAADRLKRERGLEEVRRLLAESKVTLVTVADQRRAQVAQGRFNRNSYAQFQSKLEPGYAVLRQAFAFLQEVAKNGAL